MSVRERGAHSKGVLVSSARSNNRIFGGTRDDTLRAGALEQPNDNARDVLDRGDGTDTAYFTPGQDTVGEDCEILNPEEPAPTP